MTIQLKKGDKIIIIGLFIFSFLPYGMINLSGEKQVSKVYAEIMIEGKLYKRVALTGQKDPKSFWINTPYGRNKVVIEDEGIAIKESDCRDHVCEQFGNKKNPGEVIVCLPHQLYIVIKGTGDEQTPAVDARGY